jgi:ParB family chromosome partitioning protein
MEKRRLGRGLDALLGNGEPGKALHEWPQAEVPVARIQHNPFQPRKTFDPEELAALSASVKTHGILQPLIVRPVGDGYQIIAGERRLRAAQEAGLTTVPVRIVDFNDQQTLEAALIENIQRTDLNPIEKAQGFKEYLDRLGLARSTITNLVNLLELAPEVQEAIRVNQISEAHAKLLKGVKDPAQQVALCRQIIAQGLSVKATEALVRQQRQAPPADSADKSPASAPLEKTAHVRGLEEELRQRLATRVEIRLRGKEQGQIVIHFTSNGEFLRLLEFLRR